MLINAKWIYRDSVNLNISVEGRPEVIVPVLVWAGPGYHARVHEGRHGEVYQHEQGDDPLEDWHSVPLFYQNVPLDTPVTKQIMKCSHPQSLSDHLVILTGSKRITLWSPTREAMQTWRGEILFWIYRLASCGKNLVVQNFGFSHLLLSLLTLVLILTF